MRPVDAHVHLPAYQDPSLAIDVARRNGTLLVSCTVNMDEAETNLLLREQYPSTVRCFLGVHPSDATSGRPRERLGALLDRCDGIGEIGLDAKYSDASPGSAQMETFLDQLELAEKAGKPVQVHSRGSEKLCLEALATFRLRSVLMHWFEGEESLQRLDAAGYFVSFGPALLYSKRIRRVARAVSPDRVLTESDGPVVYKALEGRSGPGLIPSVLFSLAEVKGVAFEEMGRAVEVNLTRFLEGS